MSDDLTKILDELEQLRDETDHLSCMKWSDALRRFAPALIAAGREAEEHRRLLRLVRAANALPPYLGGELYAVEKAMAATDAAVKELNNEGSDQ